MLSLIVIAWIVLCIVIHAKKLKKYYYIAGFLLFIFIGLECVIFGEWLSSKFENNDDMQYRENDVLMKEKQENMKKDFIENGVLDDNSLNQFLEDYLKLDKEIQDNKEVIDSLNNRQEQKEKFEFMLFFGQ